MVRAISAQVQAFAMPGIGIADFPAHARAIARAGIYDFAVHHDQILVPIVLRHWNIEALTGLDDDAERQRDVLVKYIGKVGKAARRLQNRRDEAIAGV
jgi:acyl-[acyl-carrier-protein] desaturase